MIPVDEQIPLEATRRRSDKLALMLIVPLTVLFLAVVIPLYIVYDVGKVVGDSMLPTLHSGEYLLITRGRPSPQRGEIVVVHLRDTDGTVIEIVKRVVAISGDKVAVRGDRIWVNGRPEAFKHEAIISDTTFPSGDYVIPDGYIYELGDNRPYSSDSRFTGALSLKDIHGKAVAVWWPVTHMRLIPSP